MGKQEAKAAYKHFVQAAKKVPDWHKNFNFVLIESMEELQKVFDESKWEPGKSFMSLDTETTDLDAEKLELVGYSFCIDGKTAYYAPVYHFEYEHNLGEDAVEFIYQRMCEARRVFMYNMKFDARVFEFRGYKENEEKLKDKRWLFVKYDMSKVNYFDVSIPCWLGDTNMKLPSLKWSALHYLGFDMMHFDEVTSDAGNFFYLNPSDNPDTVFYAASDALCTYLLVPATMRFFNESGMAGKIDNKVLYPLMHYEHEKLWLDKELIDKTMIEISNEVDRLERGVYDALGYQINLNSPAQVSQAFERLGIDTGERTATGNMKTGMKDLERLPDEIKKQFPALDMFVKYKALFKLKSSYISVLQKECDSRGFLRGAYKTQQVPTGRLAAGKDSKNTYFSPINLQALPKPHVAMHDVYDLGDRTLFSKKDNIILGYKFVMSQYDSEGNHIVPDDPSYIGWAEGMDPKNNIRACITPKLYATSGDDEFVYCAVDYSAQELRIPANLSREPVWVNAFTSGGDVHKSTAISIWGEENYNKDYRKMAKGANFCETASSLVLTDKGYLHPYEITPNEVLITRQGTDTIDNIVKVENEPCIKIQFDNGIEGTYHENHKLYCWNGKGFEWVRVKDITDTYQVITFRDKQCSIEYQPHMIDLSQYTNNERNLTKYGITIDANSKEFAYLMGLYIGDGNLNHKKCSGYIMDSYTMRQCVSKEITEKVVSLIETLGFSKDSISVSDKSDAVDIIHYGGRGLGRYIFEHFGGPNNKKIPDWVFYDWDKDAIRSFIAGMIDSDGTSSSTGWIVNNTNKGVINRLAILCNYVGMRTYMTMGESSIYKDGERITEGVNGKFKDNYSLKIYNDGNDIPLLLDYKKCKDYPKSWQYSWNIDESIRKDIVKELRESCEYKGNSVIENAIANVRDGRSGLTEFSLREVEKSGKFKIDSMWYPSKVMSKENVVEDIYAIQCPNHEYIANSMNSHNSILYGAMAQSFADNPMYHMNLTEAEEFYNKYKQALPTLFQWEERLQRRGRREGYVSTYFGRPRRIKSYLDSRQYAFANRTIVNTVVQGTASDLLKIVLCKLWSRLLNNPDYREDVAWRVTIHDEVGYCVRAARANEIVAIIEDTMRIKLPEWPVTIEVEASLGWNMGSLFAFHKVDHNDDTWHYEPKLD